MSSSGVLVDPLYVLTLSQCVEENSVYSAGKKPLVHLGLTHVDAGTEQIEKEIFLVEKTFIDGEVALLKLSRPSCQPHPRILSDEMVLRDGNQNLVAVGWGHKMVELGQDIFGHLRVETTHYFSANLCNNPKLMNGEVAEGHFCGFNSQQYASCIVDSGSPILLPHRADDFLEDGGYQTLDFLVGINFGGAPCGQAAKPDEYVDVGRLEPWIKGTIAKEAERLATGTAALEEQINNNSQPITKEDLLNTINAFAPTRPQASDYFLVATLVTICVMCFTMLMLSGHNPRNSEGGTMVIADVVEQSSPHGRTPPHLMGGTSTPAVRVIPPAQDHQRRENSAPAIRTVDAGGSMNLQRIEDAPPLNGSSPAAMKSPFEVYKERMEWLYKIKSFPFFNLDMQASILEVKMYVNQSLGSGGSGTVFPGMLLDLAIGREQKVAIKKMDPLKMTSELQIAKVVCRDRHPNIVQILGARLDKVEAPNRQSTIIDGYMVMEQMSHNLRAALQDPGVALGLSRAQALDILIGVASGLMHLHQLNVVHRDVKPGNVLLRLAIMSGSMSVEVQDVKLTDFDLSGVYEDNQVSVGICGTPGYMAPELRGEDDGAKVHGKALDMFAFGLLIREVIGGSKTTLLTSCPREWHAHVQGIADLAERCTSQDPTQRPSAAEALEVLKSVKSSSWFSSSGHLSRKLTDIIHLLHLGNNCPRAFGDSNSYGGLWWRECLKLLVAVARELHSQRSAVTNLSADIDLGSYLFIEKVGKDDGSHDYKAVFAIPESAEAVLQKGDDSVQEPSASLGTPKDNISALAQLMDDLFVATEEERFLQENALLPPELVDLMEAVRTGRNGDTYNSVADQLQAALDGGRFWLIKRAIPCRRPNSASGSGSV
eukprot:evm.model.scf_212.5 EVM.evm.TU.scf_212.5   scf_212:45270-50661(+)